MLRLLMISVLLAVSAPAQADWQKTKWGMSPSDLRASTDAILKPSDEERRRYGLPALGTPELKSVYVAGEFTFIAYYLFQNDKLRAVSLHGNPKDSVGIIVSLRSQYGPATREYRSSGSTCPTTLLEWVGGGRENDVRFVTTDCYETKHHSIVLTYMMPRLNPGL